MEDTAEEAKLHGRQCPLRASSKSSFQRFTLTRPRRGRWLLFFAFSARENYRSILRQRLTPLNGTARLYQNRRAQIKRVLRSIFASLARAILIIRDCKCHFVRERTWPEEARQRSSKAHTPWQRQSVASSRCAFREADAPELTTSTCKESGLNYLRVKWGQAPLALVVLSLVSMLSITFLISTALRHIVAELPR